LEEKENRKVVPEPPKKGPLLREAKVNLLFFYLERAKSERGFFGRLRRVLEAKVSKLTEQPGMTYHLKRLKVLSSRRNLQNARKRVESLQSLISSLESEEKRHLDAARAEAEKAHRAIASGDARAAEIAASKEREHLNRASSFSRELARVRASYPAIEEEVRRLEEAHNAAAAELLLAAAERRRRSRARTPSLIKHPAFWTSLAIILAALFIWKSLEMKKPYFSSAGSMGSRRNDHTATLLDDGKSVLIVGGADEKEKYLNSSEIFDLSSRTFSPADSLSSPRADHTATLLSDGRVLAAGGRKNPRFVHRTAEVFDPRVKRFQPIAGEMIEGRFRHSALRWGNEGVILLGGKNLSGFLKSVELFDARRNSFVALGEMAHARSDFTCHSLGKGRFIVLGGLSESGALSSIEIYRIEKKRLKLEWEGNLLHPRYKHTSTPLAGGKILIAGGAGPGNNPLDSVELFDLKKRTLLELSPLLVPRQQHTATLLKDGVLIVGGNLASDLKSAEIYRLPGGPVPCDALVLNRTNQRATLIREKGRRSIVLITGGFSFRPRGAVDEAEIFGPVQLP